MKKLYKSLATNLRIVVSIKGKRTPIQFHWGIVTKGGRMGCGFATDDKDTQEAIEQSKDFGSLIWMEDIEALQAGIPELRQMIIDEYGMQREDLKSKAQVLAALNERNINYKI